MSEILKLKYKVGQIEFEAEGPAEAVEKQRVNFMSAVLPAAVDAMVRTQAIVEAKPFIEAGNDTPLLESKSAITDNNPVTLEKSNLLRTSLSSYIKKYGDINEQDFTLFAAYFYEMKNGTKVFSIEDVKKYYPEARRPLPKNPSMSLYALAQKGYIMDADSPVDDTVKSTGIVLSADVYEDLMNIGTYSDNLFEEIIEKKTHYVLRYLTLDFLLVEKNLSSFVELANEAKWLPHYYNTIYFSLKQEQNDKKVYQMFFNLFDLVCKGRPSENWRNIDLFIENAFQDNVIENFKTRFLKYIRQHIYNANIQLDNREK